MAEQGENLSNFWDDDQNSFCQGRSFQELTLGFMNTHVVVPTKCCLSPVFYQMQGLIELARPVGIGGLSLACWNRHCHNLWTDSSLAVVPGSRGSLHKNPRHVAGSSLDLATSHCKQFMRSLPQLQVPPHNKDAVTSSHLLLKILELDAVNEGHHGNFRKNPRGTESAERIPMSVKEKEDLLNIYEDHSGSRDLPGMMAFISMQPDDVSLIRRVAQLCLETTVLVDGNEPGLGYMRCDPGISVITRTQFDRTLGHQCSSYWVSGQWTRFVPRRNEVNTAVRYPGLLLTSQVEGYLLKWDVSRHPHYERGILSPCVMGPNAAVSEVLLQRRESSRDTLPLIPLDDALRYPTLKDVKWEYNESE